MLKTFDRQSHEYTGSYNWNVGQDPLHHGIHDQADDVLNYLKIAQTKIDAYNSKITSFIEGLNFGVDVIPASVKSEESALRKLWDKNTSAPGQADQIKDMLRATIIVPKGLNGVKHLEQVIQALITHPDTKAYKDQFFRPNSETGYRSFKAIISVDGHLSELLVDYEGMRQVGEITAGLRNFERHLRQFEVEAPQRCSPRNSNGFDRSVAKLISQSNSMMVQIREIRKMFHETFAQEEGLNILLDPALQNNRHNFSMKELGETFSKAVNGSTLGRGLNQVAQRVGVLFPNLIPRN